MAATGRLEELVDPRHTTILYMKMERGVVGDRARFPGPREVVKVEALIERRNFALAALPLTCCPP